MSAKKAHGMHEALCYDHSYSFKLELCAQLYQRNTTETYLKAVASGGTEMCNRIFKDLPQARIMKTTAHLKGLTASNKAWQKVSNWILMSYY